MIKQGVVLASGLGSRLTKDGNSEPKPLMPVGGMPLIERIIRLMKNAGIENIVVVVGFKKEMIIDFVKRKKLEVTIAENDEYEKSNGISVLKAMPYLVPGEPFLLSMSDHIFSNDFIDKFIHSATPLLEKFDSILAVDRNIEGVFDIDDATKVFTEEDKIIKIGKDLKAYNAIDTGLFLCKSILLEKLNAVYAEKGDVSLSAGMFVLAEEKRFGYADMTKNLWQDVDTPSMKFEAEKRLLESVIDETKKHRPVWEQWLDEGVMKIILADFRNESSYIAYSHIIYAVFLVFCLSVGLRFNLAFFSVFLFAGTMAFFNIKKLFERMSPVAAFQKAGDYETILKPALLTISMLPVFFDSAPFTAIVVLFFCIGAILHPLMKTYSKIQLPQIRADIADNFISYPFFTFLLPLLLLVQMPSTIISFLFAALLIFNTLNSSENK